MAGRFNPEVQIVAIHDGLITATAIADIVSEIWLVSSCARQIQPRTCSHLGRVGVTLDNGGR